jgi:hypothetical protein
MLLVHEHLELVGMALGHRRRGGEVAIRCTQRPSLSNTDLIFGSTEDTTGRSLLLQHLLLMCVGETDLDEMFIATRHGDGGVVELLDDFVADVTGLEARDGQQGTRRPRTWQGAYRAKPTPRPVPEESRRILLEQTLWGAKIDASCWEQSVMWIKHSEGATYMLVHVLGNVGDIKIGVALVGELLEFGVEGFLEKKVSGRSGGGSDSNVPEQS